MDEYRAGQQKALKRFGLSKYARVVTELQPHQERVRQRIQEQPGLVVAHGLGSGKCIKGDTLVYTNYGLLPIQALFAKHPDAGNSEETFKVKGLQVVHWDGEKNLSWVPVAGLYRQKLPAKESTLIVRTQRGNALEVTAAHPFPVVREGRIEWVPAGALQKKDWLAVARQLPSSNFSVPWTPELARLLTWQIAEGWEDAEKPVTVITQKNTKILWQLRKLFKTMFPASGSGHIREPENHSAYLVIHAVEYQRALRMRGYVWGHNSAEKKFPASLLLASDEVLKIAISSFWEAEGSIGAANAEISSASKYLLEQYRMLLLRFGVRTAINRMRKCATNGTRTMRTYWRLHISGVDLRKFLALVANPFSEKTLGLRKVAAKKENVNYGIPVNWIYETIPTLPSRVLRGSTLKCMSINEHKVEEWVGHLAWLGEEGWTYYQEQAKKLGGTAGKYSERTANVLRDIAGGCMAAAVRLQRLASNGLRYEQIASIKPGESGGYVYDLIIGKEEYAQNNYVVAGGLIVHNTFSSIAAADALDMPRNVIVPAALQANYLKELDRHRAEGAKDFNIHSLQRLTTSPNHGKDLNNGLMIIDEAHRLRDPATKANQLFKSFNPQKRLLLTASPVYNHPADLSALVNLAAGERILPEDRKLFEKEYTRTEKVYPGMWKYLMGVRPGERTVLDNKDKLKGHLQKWVDYHGNAGNEHFPSSTEETVSVPMSQKQQEIYDSLLQQAPFWIRKKIEAGLPPSKQEAKSLTAFLSGQRLVSNSPQPFVEGMNMDEAVEHSPKIQEAFNRFMAKNKENPNHKAVVYSNFLQGGLEPYKHLLEKNQVPYGLFTGEMKKQQRDQLVRDYNENKIKALLLSSAGGEGLDLKGTRQLQLLDPHFNEEKLRQIIGRGIRYKSHSHLPEPERSVHVERYLAENRPSWWHNFRNEKNPDMAADAYLSQLSQEKLKLNDQVLELLQEKDSK
jgi:superfamily II DNA or RNA helicase